MKRMLLVALVLLGASLLPVGQHDASAATRSVCLDPGHGGSDPGASNGGITEKELNLDVAKRLASLLAQGGYGVYLTRTGDQTLSNNDRYTFCNRTGATILVSIHHNGSSDPNIDYSLALYMKKSDVPLATALVDALSSGLGTRNAGVRRFSSGVLLKSTMPAAISEGFFLTSEYEYGLLTDGSDRRRQEEAKALYNGIVNYFLQGR